jgi:hypothetical protein
MTRPKCPKGKFNQVKFLVDDREKKLLVEVVEKLQTSQAEVFRQGLIYIAYKNGLQSDVDESNFYKSA